jgi:hypothetical protein
MNRNAQIYAFQISSIEVLTRPSPVKGRINEDNWFVWESPGFLGSVVCAVIDGAGLRLPFQQLESKLQKLWPSLSPAAFAANIVKKSLLEQMQRDPEFPLQEVLITANKNLHQQIERTIGKFNIENVLFELGGKWANDPRNVRLILPACAVTLIRFDLVNGIVDFAHLGDTSLLEIRHNGKVIRHTNDQMGKFDQAAFEAISEYQKRENLPDFRVAVLSQEGRRFIIESGLHLNYVDDNGETNRNNGCGVINGLPEVKDYIETGTVKIDPSKTLGFVLMSDGLELLQSLQENKLQHDNRINLMGNIIRGAGLLGLYKAMDEMVEKDSSFNAYPRTKIKDDATGIYLQIKKESNNINQ